jgi:DNA-3-methyladenine glycosylase II
MSHRRAVIHLKRADPVMATVIEAVGSCRFQIRSEGTHFEALARSIVFQQLSTKAANTIYLRFAELFKNKAPVASTLLKLPDEQLRAVGLSRQKTSYLRDLSSKVHAGEVPVETLHELSDAEVIAALTKIKGIGRWTAQMFLMFRLGRPDVLPDLDLGIQKAIQRAYRMRKLPTPDRVLKVGAKWAPHRTIASWYLWRSLEVEM